jgi:hypothetical protein
LLIAKNRFGTNGSISTIFKKVQGQVFAERQQASSAPRRMQNERMFSEPEQDEDVLKQDARPIYLR